MIKITACNRAWFVAFEILPMFAFEMKFSGISGKLRCWVYISRWILCWTIEISWFWLSSQSFCTGKHFLHGKFKSIEGLHFTYWIKSNNWYLQQCQILQQFKIEFILKSGVRFRGVDYLRSIQTFIILTFSRRVAYVCVWEKVGGGDRGMERKKRERERES